MTTAPKEPALKEPVTSDDAAYWRQEVARLPVEIDAVERLVDEYRRDMARLANAALHRLQTAAQLLPKAAQCLAGATEGLQNLRECLDYAQQRLAECEAAEDLDGSGPFADDSIPTLTSEQFQAQCEAARAERLSGLTGEALRAELAAIDQEAYDDAIVEDGPLADEP